MAKNFSSFKSVSEAYKALHSKENDEKLESCFSSIGFVTNFNDSVDELVKRDRKKP